MAVAEMATVTAETPSPAPDVNAASAQWLASLATPEVNVEPVVEAPVVEKPVALNSAGRPYDPETGKLLPVKPKEEVPAAEVPKEGTEVVESPAEGEQPADGEAPPDGEAEVPAEVEEEVKAEAVTLPGLKERGETDLEVDIADPEVAERLRRLVNDGMRKRDYTEKMREYETFTREKDELRRSLQEFPEAFVLQTVEPSRQLQLTKALVTEHWETIFPFLEQMAKDPTKVLTARLSTRDATTQQERDMAVRRDADRRADEILGEARKLVPDSADDEMMAAFMKDAERDLIDAHGAGKTVSKETVASLLANRVKMYRFTAEAPAKRPVVVRRPVTVAEAQKAQDRIKENAGVKKSAAAIPPAGRGAVTVRKPLVPKGADVEAASEALANAKSWADFRPNQ